MEDQNYRTNQRKQYYFILNRKKKFIHKIIGFDNSGINNNGNKYRNK